MASSPWDLSKIQALLKRSNRQIAHPLTTTPRLEYSSLVDGPCVYGNKKLMRIDYKDDVDDDGDDINDDDDDVDDDEDDKDDEE